MTAACEQSPECRPTKNGYCRRCAFRAQWSKPGFREKHAAAQKTRLANPIAMAAHKKRSARNIMSFHNNPENHERRRLNALQALELTRNPDVVAKRTASSMSKRFNWLPDAYRDFYRDLRRHRIPAAEARNLIEQQIAHDRKKRIDAMFRSMEPRSAA